MSKTEQSLLNVAMIGCGGYAALLAKWINEVPEFCRLTAVCTRRTDSDAALQLMAEGVQVYSDIDALLTGIGSAQCDAVMIPTSIESHFEYAKKVLEAGYHVLLEKPPVATIQDLDQLIELQKQSGRFIAVNFQYLYGHMTDVLKTRLASGEFGRVRSVKAHAIMRRSESYFNRSDWSGKLMVEGRWVLDGSVGNPFAHLMAEALYLATTEDGMAVPSLLQAELYHANDIESEDTSVVRLKTTEEVDVFYCTSLCGSKGVSACCIIETEQAVIELTNYFKAEICWRDGRIETIETPDYNDGHARRLMLKDFSVNLSEGSRPKITVEECRPFLLAWNGAFESAGIPTEIPEAVILRAHSPEGKNRFVNGGAVRTLPEIDQLSSQALAGQTLFSELGVEWAVSGELIDLSKYEFFPAISVPLVEIGQQKLALS